MIDRLAELETRYEEVSRQLSTPEAASDRTLMTELGRELSRLEPIVAALREWRTVLSELDEARGMSDDPDEAMRAMAREEVERLAARSGELEAGLRLQLVPKDPNDDKNVIVEIRAGTGGDEAALFAADLFRMYTRYAERQRWKVEVLSSSETDGGGFNEVIFEVARRGRLLPPAATSAACTACSACRPPRRRAASTPRPPPWRCCPRRKRSTSRSTTRTCGSTSIARRARRPERQHDRLGRAHHPPADRASSSPARTRRASSRTSARR